MSYEFLEGRQYIMPTHFGPMCGPRHSSDGGRFPQPDLRAIEIYTASFLTDADVLRHLLPPRFDLYGEPTVTVTMVYMSGIAWLAGRGYNTLGVTANVRFAGEHSNAWGPLQLVLWENLADAILTGREQLGFSKIYCDLPPPRRTESEASCTASWQGHRFFELELADLTASAEVPPPPSNEKGEGGILSLRYVPDIDDTCRPRLVETTFVPFLTRSARTGS